MGVLRCGGSEQILHSEALPNATRSRFFSDSWLLYLTWANLLWLSMIVSGLGVHELLIMHRFASGPDSLQLYECPDQRLIQSPHKNYG